MVNIILLIPPISWGDGGRCGGWSSFRTVLVYNTPGTSSREAMCVEDPPLWRDDLHWLDAGPQREVIES